PSDEKKQTIRFSEDQLYYTLNSDVDELLFLFWENETYNTLGNNWEYAPYDEIIARRGEGSRKFLFGETHINGSKQVAIHGYNQIGSSTLFDMDAVGDWEVDDDASSLALDTDQKYEGSGSLS